MEAKQKKQMDLLTAIEQIVEKAKDSMLFWQVIVLLWICKGWKNMW